MGEKGNLDPLDVSSAQGAAATTEQAVARQMSDAQQRLTPPPGGPNGGPADVTSAPPSVLPVVSLGGRGDDVHPSPEDPAPNPPAL